MSELNEEKKKVGVFLSKTIAINFLSTDHRINYPIACMNSDVFLDVEEKLYTEYPELRNKNIYFIANGDVINRNNTLEQNNIKNGNQILIHFKENIY